MKLGHIKYTPEDMEQDPPQSNETPPPNENIPADPVMKEPATEEKDAGTDAPDVAADIDETQDQLNVVQEKSEAIQDVIKNEGMDAAKLSNAAQTLDEIQASASNMIVSDKALTPFGAKVITQTVESIHKSLGFEKHTLPTLEAFNSTWTKTDASRLTLESLEKTQASIGERIVLAFKAVIRTVFGFLSNLFKNRGLLESYVTKLLGFAKSLDGEHKPKEENVRGEFVRRLQYTDYTNLDSTRLILATASVSIHEYSEVNKTAQAIRDGRDIETSMKDLGDKDKGHVCETLVKIGSSKISVYGAYPDAMSIIPSDDIGGFTFISNRGDGTDIPKDALALDKTECIDILEIALKLIKDLRSAESVTNRISDAVSVIFKKIEQQYAAFRGALGNEEQAELAKSRDTALKIQKLLTQSVAKLPDTIFNSVKYACDYAKASLNNLEEV